MAQFFLESHYIPKYFQNINICIHFSGELWAFP